MYPGNYEDYLWRKGGGSSPIVAEVEAEPEPTRVAVAAEPKKRVNPMKLKAEDQAWRSESALRSWNRDRATRSSAGGFQERGGNDAGVLTWWRAGGTGAERSRGGAILSDGSDRLTRLS